ncbi:MAG TPA: zf-HC2 domain-containing protein [Armatimonadota bacterium]|nr:zf-HC2 domain-containing protein [Armatimonadota bacterium]
MINHEIAPACRQFLDGLEPFLDNEMPDAEREEITRHLSGCSSCRAEIRLLTMISNAARRRTHAVASDRVRTRLMEVVESDGVRVSPSSSQTRRIIIEAGGVREERFEVPARIRRRQISPARPTNRIYHGFEYREATVGGQRVIRTMRMG